MPRHAKSKSKTRQDYVEISEKWKAYAVKLYQQEQQKPIGVERLSLQGICNKAEGECWRQENTHIHIAKSNLQHWVKGGKTKAQSNAEKSWITPEEADVLIEYAIQIALQGHGFTMECLEEHANQILRMRLGQEFPGVGKNWTAQFMEKHSDRLSTYWSSPLDHSRARAANPNTKEVFYNLVERVINGEDGKEPISDELIYAADETGIQRGLGVKQRIIGPTGRNIIHQQESGDRENITSLVTICADGTDLPPVIIFKGEYFQTRWKQDNPLNAS